MKRVYYSFLLILAGLSAFVGMQGCKKINIVSTTTTDQNIYEYLATRPDKYGSFARIIEKSGYSGFLNAYGSYTIFAPDNQAVSLYLTEINKASVDQITEPEAQTIVKFHLLEDTLTTSSFKDGKLPLVTMLGQYLVTSVRNVGGNSSFEVNRQGLVKEGNIKTGNGFIHGLDHVLKPATQNLFEQIAANPNLSIFRQALEETKYKDTLININTTDSNRRWLTVLAETNQALQDSGITSYAQLRARYSNTGNPANQDDSLHIYVAYHIMFGAKYLADIVSANSHTSLQPLEVLASKLDGEKVLINDIDFNGVYERGVELDRANSDYSATNGVLHTSKGHFRPKVRVPTPVYWDVADFPEVRKLPGIFRAGSYTFAYGSIKDITWEKSDAANDLIYTYSTSTSFPVYYGDYLTLRLGATGARNFWYEFKTPMLVKGKYKVWICYRAGKQSGTLGAAGGSNCTVQCSFNGQGLTRPFAFTEQRPNLSDGEMEALGWKRYMSTNEQYLSGRLVGIVDVPTTDRHTLRMQGLPVSGTGQNSNWLDMIHFIPITSHQFLPRFTRAGTQVFF